MEPYRIVPGLGDEALSTVVKEQLERAGVGRIVGTALTRKNIVPRVVELSANMVILADNLVGDKETDDEWIDIIEDLRKVDLQMRIVFFCKRSDEDLFLAKLATLMVTDIFNEHKFPAGWTEQMLQPPKYAHAEKFFRKREEAVADLRKRKVKAQETPEEILKKMLTPQAEVPKPASAPAASTDKATEPAATPTTINNFEKEKVVIKKEKEYIIEQVKIPPRSTVVVSLFSGAGSSLLTRILAEYIASLQVDTGVVESAVVPPATFEIVNGWQMLDNRKEDWRSWHSVIRKAEGTPSWGDILELERVKYIARSTREPITYDEWTEQDTAYLLAYSRNISVLFYDASTNFDDPREQIVLKSADRILVVGGYDVIRMEREFRKFERFLMPFQDKLLFIMNKSTPRLERIHDGEIRTLYDTRTLYHVPAMVPLVELYMEGDSFWKCRYVKEEQKQAMREVMVEVANAILGEEVVKRLHARKKGGLLQRIGNFFNTGGDELDLDEGTA